MATVVVKVIEERRGYIVRLGIDIEDYDDIPNKIFYNDEVVDAMMYMISSTSPQSFDNGIYVRKNRLHEIERDIEKFYKEYGQYFGKKIRLKFVRTTMNSDTIEIDNSIVKEKNSAGKKVPVELIKKSFGKTIEKPAVTAVKESMKTAKVQTVSTETPREEKHRTTSVFEISVDEIDIPEV